MKPIKLLLAQINTTVGDIENNLDKIKEALIQARAGGAELVVFPELTVTGYPPEDLLFRSSFIDRNLAALKRIKQWTKSVAAIVGFVDRDSEGRLYNAAAIFSNNKLLGVYHKNKLPNYGVFDEKRYFNEGARPYAFRLKGKKIGVTICEDIWIKDSYVYDKRYYQDLDLLINISASPYHVDKEKVREKVLKGLTQKTRVPVVYLNLVGGQDELIFDGGSVLVDQKGIALAQAKRFHEELLFTQWPSKSQVAARPLLRSQAVYQALVMGTHDYIVKNGFKKVLIGLSGGVDSALVARIAVDAIGPGNVVGVTMPSGFTSKETYKDVWLLAKNLGIECLDLKIGGVFGNYLKLLKPAFGPNNRFGPAEENLQARIRGSLLMAISNKFGSLVLTTGNKSEMATGYCTLYGDMAGGFAVIKDVPKTLVYELCLWRNRLTPKNSIPEGILRRAPTAELRPNQKDQDTLPPYSLLDRILEDYVENDLSVKQISKKGPNKAIVKKVARMVDLNEYKRRQAPPGVKITPRAFGRDRRMPITQRCAQ